MIVRWYMALQELDFTIEFVAGVDNDIADAMSRLCRNNMSDSLLEYSPDTYLQSLLRDRKFVIKTDHKNLLFISEHSNQ